MTIEITRKELLQRGAAGATILSLPGLLAACGGGGSGGDEGELKDVLNFSNWELYIDTPSTRKAAGLTGPTTLQQFTTETGIKVNYYEDVNDNPGYFAKVQGRLSRGQGIDRDIIVSTDNDRFLGEYITQRLGAEARQEPHSEHLESHRRAGAPAVRREPRLLTALVLGHGRHRLERGRHRTCDDGHAAARGPQAEGQGRRLELHGRHPGLDHARERRRSGESHRRVVRPSAGRRPEGAGRGPDPALLRQRLRAAAGDGRPRSEHGVVRRHLQSPGAEGQVGNRGAGRDHLDGQHAHSPRRERSHRLDVHELRLRPEDRRPTRARCRLHLGRQGRPRGGCEARSERRRQHARLPD